MSGVVLCVGALTWDTIFRLDELPSRGGKYLPLETVEVAEGMAAAQAASIVRLGGAGALWAAVGDDATGTRLVRQITEAGVDTSRVRTVPGARSGFSTILMRRCASRQPLRPISTASPPSCATSAGRPPPNWL
jgi:sulfofructose kinase